MAFRLTPRDSAFYTMFTDAGRNLATAADLLGGLMDPDVDHEVGAKDLRDCEHVGDGDASDHASAQHQLRDAVR